jgi:hypothetical protein
LQGLRLRVPGRPPYVHDVLLGERLAVARGGRPRLRPIASRPALNPVCNIFAASSCICHLTGMSTRRGCSCVRCTLPGADLGNNDYLSRWDLGSPHAPSHGLQLTRTGLSQVVDVKVVLTRQGRPNTQPARIAECLVGDPTGVIIFTARNEQGDARRAHAAPVDVQVTFVVKCSSLFTAQGC